MLLGVNHSIGKHVKPATVNVGVTRGKVDRDRSTQVTPVNGNLSRPSRLGERGTRLNPIPPARGTWDSSFVSNEPSYVGQHQPIRVDKAVKRIGKTYPIHFHTRDEARQWLNQQEQKKRNREENDPQKQIQSLMLDKLKREREQHMRKLQNMYLTEDKRQELNSKHLNGKALNLGENFQDVFAEADRQARQEVQEQPPPTTEERLEDAQEEQHQQSLRPAEIAVAGAGATPDPQEREQSGTVARQPKQIAVTQGEVAKGAPLPMGTRQKARAVARELRGQFGSGTVNRESQKLFGKPSSSLNVTQVKQLRDLMGST